MSDKAMGVVLVIGLWGMVLVVVWRAYSYGADSVRREAVKAGVAEYQSGPEGTPKFAWKAAR